nr:MAG TPA: hypothetical protein [Crassvirales sp.]
MCSRSQMNLEMDSDLRERIALFGNLATQLAVLEEENKEESQELREMLKLEVFMPSTYYDREGKTIEIAVKDGVISIGLSILAMRDNHIVIPIRPDLDWTHQSQFHMLELCSIGAGKPYEFNQWYIDQYMEKFGVEQYVPSVFPEIYADRVIKLKGGEDDQTVQFILSNIVMYSKRTLQNFVDDAVRMRRISSSHITKGKLIRIKYSKELSERFTVI